MAYILALDILLAPPNRKVSARFGAPRGRAIFHSQIARVIFPPANSRKPHERSVFGARVSFAKLAPTSAGGMTIKKTRSKLGDNTRVLTSLRTTLMNNI
jgi:hypothetical protein